MATLAPLTPSRQPFGVLSDVKLRTLQSVKNRQNAIAPCSEPSLKRRAPSPEISDSENVDPNLLDTYGKRKRAAFNDDVSLSKPSRYNVQIVSPVAKPRVFTATATPKLDTFQRPSPAPLSAPAAAGRSPTRGKRMGLLKSSRRFAPPTFGTKPALSIAEALQGTIVHKKAKKVRTLEEVRPKSWFFDIFEESEEQQDYRMNEWTITQSATALDISDDEGRPQEKTDRGKENIDPNEMSITMTRSMSAAAKIADQDVDKDMDTDEVRTPLGDLNPSEYYAKGLDATSVVLVHDDDALEAEEQHLVSTADVVVQAQREADFTFESDDKLPNVLGDHTTELDLGAFLAASEPAWCIAEPPVAVSPCKDSLVAPDDGPIDIWESESAKDETEKDETKFDDNGAFTLQEL